MTSEGLGEMFEGDSADMCAGKFPLVSMGGRAKGLTCADPGARTPSALVEIFKKQKTGSKPAAGCKLILDLASEGHLRPVGTGLLSPILKVDGEVAEEEQAKYSFVSMYVR